MWRSSLTPAHLVEIEDIEAVPDWFRDLGTDWIRYFSNRLDLYRPIAPRLADLLRHTKRDVIIDMCSGSGGGWLSLIQHLDRLQFGDVQIVLTDKHPNLGAAAHVEATSKSRIVYRKEHTDILASDWDTNDLRTMTMAFHHFPRQQAVTILQKAVSASAPIAIFDATGPGLLRQVPRLFAYLIVPFALALNIFIPLLVLFSTPAIRPIRYTRLVLTYLLPLVPIYIWWDATISILRVYNTNELRQIVGEADPDHTFDWDIGVAGGRGPRAITYVLGCPHTGS